jgi:hypothetical protein
VVNGKIKLNDLAAERSRASAELESIDSDIAADDRGIARLDDLKRILGKAARFTSDLTSGKAASSAAELRALDDQRKVMVKMRAQQAELASRAEQDEKDGIITRSDLEKERQMLSQLDLALLDNGRAILRSESDMRENALTQKAIERSDAPLAPDLLLREEQIVHVEIESIKLDADKRSKLAQRRDLADRIAKMDELRAHLDSRPLYRATRERIDVAFVPYTQLDAVKSDADVYSCVWGLFMCKQVGTVSELVEGEVLVQDPWGAPARGQYAVLDLWDHEAAKAKMLRVRAAAHDGATAALRAVSVAPR